MVVFQIRNEFLALGAFLGLDYFNFFQNGGHTPGRFVRGFDYDDAG